MLTETFHSDLIQQALGPDLKEVLSVGRDTLHDFKALSTDSRKVGPGTLFVAIAGDQFDGHDFITTAIENGASGILSQKPKPENLPQSSADGRGFIFYQVSSELGTQGAYRRISQLWRKQFTIPIEAVAGSEGKTSTKELLAAILQGKYSSVLKTQGSQNGFLGIPMTLLELRPHHQIAVVEVGIDEIGAMVQHLPLVAPTLALLVSIGPEHLEKLRNVETVAQEEFLALSMTEKAGGQIVLNLDDPWIRKLAPTLAQTNHPSCGFSEAQLGDAREDGTKLFYRGETYPLPMPGHHNATNLLIAITAALTLGLTPSEIRKGLSGFKQAPGRSEVQKLPSGAIVLCDYYNANPTSMLAGLKLLTQISLPSGQSNRIPRWACLGDMLELGADEELFHRNLAPPIVELEIENVLLYGPRMRFLYSELQALGFKGSVNYFTTQEQLGQFLVEHSGPTDAIMIKGSRGMRMENIWKILEPARNSLP